MLCSKTSTDFLKDLALDESKKFNRADATISRLCSKVEKQAAVVSVASGPKAILRKRSQSQPNLVPEVTNYCNINRYQKDFFGREKIIQKIRKELDHDKSDGPFRCAGLWGKWGVGKTSIAREYCRQRRQDGVTLIMWVNAATELELTQSMSQIAVDLRLETTKPGNVQQNTHALRNMIEGRGKSTSPSMNIGVANLVQ